MAGQLYRAVARTGGLQPVVDTIREYMAKKKRQEITNKLVDLMSQTGQDISNIGNQKDRIDVNPDVYLGSQKSPLSFQEKKAPSQKEKYSKASERANQALATLYSDPDMWEHGNPNQVNALAGLLNQRVQALAPRKDEISPVNKNTVGFLRNGNFEKNPIYKEEEKEVKPTERIISDEPISATRNLVKKGYVNPKVDPAKSLFQLPGKEGEPKDYSLGDFDVVETSRATQVRRDKPPKDGKNKDKKGGIKEGTSQLIANVLNPPADIKPEDHGVYKDNAYENIKLQTLSPRSYEFINNVETIYSKGDKSGKTKYLSPKQLKDEAIKHAQSGRLSDDEADELADFLIYYTRIHPGLMKESKPQSLFEEEE